MKIISNKALALVALLSITTSPVSAVLITDTVTVDGTKWAQVDLFRNVSWNTWNAACPAGACIPGSSVGGYDMTGWTWASAAQVIGLFEFVSGLTADATPDGGVVQELNSIWAPELLTMFRPTSTSYWFGHRYIAGLISTDSNDTEWDRGGVASLGDLKAQDRIDYGKTDDDAIVKRVAAYHNGAWVVQSASIPEPSTLAIFGLGLMGLALRRFKKQS
jgi:hypothetical protein